MSPALSAACAEILFRTPPRQTRTRRESAILAGGVFQTIAGDVRPIATWKWGEGPVILLVHGWGGHAGRLARFVDPLKAAGFSVVAFDAPAHGASAGRHVSLPEISRAIASVAGHFGPLTGVIGRATAARELDEARKRDEGDGLSILRLLVTSELALGSRVETSRPPFAKRMPAAESRRSRS